MNILSNENNTSTLKLIICAKIGKKNVKIQLLKNDEATPSPKRIPNLKISEDVNIFSSNAASVYLLSSPKQQGYLECSEWLEWEAVKLLPSVANITGPKAIAEEAAVLLVKLMASLNDQLQGKKYILGEALSAADVSIWCTLYPIFINANLKNQFLSNSSKLGNIITWQESIASLQSVQDALREYPLNPTELCKVLHTTCIGGISSLSSNVPQRLNVENDSSSTPASSPEVKLEAEVTEEEKRLAEDYWSNGEKLLDQKLPIERTVLPKEGYKNVLITSALPYVNNVPHLGNIIGCVLSADVFARYCRLCNYNTLFVCGTDEYGTATETKALEEGLTPKQICDKYFEIHNAVYRWFGIGFDYFGRTTTPEQTEIVQDMFKKINSNGFLNVQTIEQLRCEGCDRFLADRFVEGMCPHLGCGYEDARGDQCDGCGKLINATELIRPRCKLCSKAPILRDSKHFFLDLPLLEPLLRTWIESSSPGWSSNAQQITRAWLRAGLRARCITRDLHWGVPVPQEGFSSKVFYVWFDAPIGYISITKRYTKDYEKWWKPNPIHNVNLYQFMAKDNVPFHSVMFPAVLLGVGQKNVMVKHIMATEYLNYEDGKFSKSRGVGVFGTDAQDTGIPADVFRFYLVSIRPEGQDSNFSWQDLATRNNSELLNNLGNFVNRSAVFCAKNFDGVMPGVELTDSELRLVAIVNREIKGYVDAMEECKQRDALKHVMNISRLGNQYIQMQQPWVLLKGTDDAKSQAATVVGMACNLSCLLGVLIQPVMPETSHLLLTQLGTSIDQVGRVNPQCPSFRLLLPRGHKIGNPSPLFQKIEPATVEELKKRYAGRQASPAKETPKGTAGVKLSFEDLKKKLDAQADKVRQLKSGGGEKSLWEPELKVLMELKKQLAEAEKTAQPAGPRSLADIDADIERQGTKVRTLKTSKVDKSVWQPEVDILLALKKERLSADSSGADKSQEKEKPKEVTKKIEGSSEKKDTKSSGGNKRKTATIESQIERLVEELKRLAENGADEAALQAKENTLKKLRDTAEKGLSGGKK